MQHHSKAFFVTPHLYLVQSFVISIPSLRSYVMQHLAYRLVSGKKWPENSDTLTVTAKTEFPDVVGPAI